jgi:magnesium chelatase subunit I
MLLNGRVKDIDSLVFETVKLSPSSSPRFYLEGEQIDIWQKPHSEYHSKTPVDYVREKIAALEEEGIDSFPDIVGKELEKELVKEALFSGSPILLRGERGYGKTTFAKTIGKLLPEKTLTIKGCKIYDDPVAPTCFSCKAKLTYEERVDLIFAPRVWVRIPGDPMMTTRQLIGGLSIQKIREGYDLDHPEVFIPGRALKANRGVGYFDELGAVPTSLQTLLHELFEEGQVTTTEGDILPFKISTIEIASTNPANYRGTSPIKEPLLDRMESIEIGPPETLEEEIEIGKRNMHIKKAQNREPRIPEWHLRILARAVRLGRDKEESEIAKKIQTAPSCRATIKLMDHVQSKALRSGRKVALFADYGKEFENITLALAGRIEVEFGVRESKKEIVKALVEEAIRRTAKEVYDKIPDEQFDQFYEDVYSNAERQNGEKYIVIEKTATEKLRQSIAVLSAVRAVTGDVDDETFLSALEMLMHSITVCTPRFVERKNGGYIMRERVDEGRMRRVQ